MKVRRVVTGHNEAGKSVLKWDSEIEGKPGRAGFEKVDFWASDSLPVQLTEADPVLKEFGTTIANGSVFRFCRYEPGVSERWHRHRFDRLRGRPLRGDRHGA